MPFYDMMCKKCNHEWDVLLKISEMDKPLGEPCPSCKEVGGIERRILGAPSFGDPFRMGLRKTDGEFKDVMRRIHERNYGSTLAETSTLTHI